VGRAWVYAVIIVSLAGCPVFVKAPETRIKGKDTVAVIFDESEFKARVVDSLTASLGQLGKRVVADRLKRAKYYRAEDYAAVVYFADLWAWHTPWHAKRYWRRNGEAGNIVFVVTAGDPDAKISKPFDAVTSASDPEKARPVAEEILRRLGGMM